VLLDTKTGFERLDVADVAWKECSEELLARSGVISHWKGSYEAPPPVPPDAIQKDDAESLLRKLLERREERYLAATYILAVMLERKRILRVKAQQKEGGRRTFIYEHPRSGDIFAITDPDLQLDQLEEVQQMVSELLERGMTDGNALAADMAPPTEPTAFAEQPAPAAEASALGELVSVAQPAEPSREPPGLVGESEVG
jgi:hypothetical protein